MAQDHIEVSLVHRQVDRLAQGAARMVNPVDRISQLGEIPEILDRRIAPAAFQGPDKGRAVGRDEDRVVAADLDRLVPVAGKLRELGRRRQGGWMPNLLALHRW